ncbi:MAG: hypothetical protein JRH07_08025 [Deltaproteobacteria bacterium]|nr:hypothetical protein [Deltaproteobacteria bacterium]
MVLSGRPILRERRRFRRRPCAIPVELKEYDRTFSGASLVNIGRGGGMVQTEVALRPGAFVRLKAAGREEFRSERIVLMARTVWTMPASGRHTLCGLGFLEGQGGAFRRLSRFEESLRARNRAEVLGLPFVDLDPSMVERGILGYIKRDLAFSLNCIPMKLRGDRLMVAMAEPEDEGVLKRLELFSECRIVPVVATPRAIRDTLNQCWGPAYVAPERKGAVVPSSGMSRQGRKRRILTLASSTAALSGECLGANLAALLNRRERHVVLAEFAGGAPFPPRDIPGGLGREGEWLILTLPGRAPSTWPDPAIEADEALLIFSPADWQRGCSYIEAVFDRFVKARRDWEGTSMGIRGRRRVLEFSLICAGSYHPQEGFRTFERLSRRVHLALDMKEPGLDVRLHYLGGIPADERSIRRLQRGGVPLAVGRPHLPASRSMAHIARSLLQPKHERDPRIPPGRSLVSRIFHRAISGFNRGRAGYRIR